MTFPSLTKWPCLLVQGEKVTMEQAAEIIVRTDTFYFGCNDKSWEESLYHAIGGSHDNFKRMDALRREFRILDIGYLNNSRIASCWIGGPHGWCNWNGSISCNNHNIGKWPDCEDILEEWTIIAEAFPFLKLESQLLSGEQGEDDLRPVIQFSVTNGVVTYSVEPKELLTSVCDNATDLFIKNYGSPGRERGCTIEQFQNALEIVRAGCSQTQ